MRAPGGTALPVYLGTATLARSATEAAGPALLVVSVAVLGSATTGSYVVAAMTASAAIGGPVVGALIDRSADRRRGFALAMVVLATGLAAIALTIGRVPLWVVLALAVATGVGHPALTGAWSAQLPHLIPAASLHRAYSADAATYSVAAVVAPPMAAALVAVSLTAPLWLPVALAAAAVVALRFVPIPRAVGAERTTRLRDDLRSGLAVMFGVPALRRTVVLTTVGFAGQAAVFVTAPVYAQQLTGSLGFTGVILGAFALGGVISALWFTRRPVQRPDRAILVGTTISALFLAGIALAPTQGLLLAAAFAMGAAEPPIISSMFRVRARESPPAVQSQVFTTSASLRTTAFALGTAACGALLPLGVGVVIAFGTALHLVSVLIGIALGPRLPAPSQWLRRE